MLLFASISTSKPIFSKSCIYVSRTSISLIVRCIHTHHKSHWTLGVYELLASFSYMTLSAKACWSSICIPCAVCNTIYELCTCHIILHSGVSLKSHTCDSGLLLFLKFSEPWAPVLHLSTSLLKSNHAWAGLLWVFLYGE